MKLIKYNGGIVSFQLPKDWKEEYYSDGDAAFYQEDSDLGTLRLSIQAVEVKDDYADSIELLSESGLYVEDGFSLKEEVKLVNEDGDDVLVYLWEVVVPVDSKERRIVLFSYTIPAIQEEDIQVNMELNFIRNTILKASYLKSNE